MSPHGEMVETAGTSRKIWILRNGLARQLIGQFLGEFEDYCKMPCDFLKLLPWNEEKQAFEAKADEVLGIDQAISFNDGSDEWRVGISFRLNPPNELSPWTVAFGMFVTERDFQYSVRIGNRGSQLVDLDARPKREAFFASVVADIKKSLEEPKEARGAGYGFRVQTA